MPVLTVMNQKGGVGKTTTTVNLAYAFLERGWRVLAVDFDPQGNLTTCCGLADPNQFGRGQTIADAVLTAVRAPFATGTTLRDVIVSSPAGLDLVPANNQLANAEAALHQVFGREYALRDVLADLGDAYDVILVDSVPTFGLLAINGLAAANGLVIPVQAEFLAVHGLAQLLESVRVVQERLNPQLEIWGVLLTMVDGRTRHSREIVSAVRETVPSDVPVLRTQIPVDVQLKESTRAGVSVIAHDPSGRASRAYRELAAELEHFLTAGEPSRERATLKPTAPKPSSFREDPRVGQVAAGGVRDGQDREEEPTVARSALLPLQPPEMPLALPEPGPDRMLVESRASEPGHFPSDSPDSRDASAENLERSVNALASSHREVPQPKATPPEEDLESTPLRKRLDPLAAMKTIGQGGTQPSTDAQLGTLCPYLGLADDPSRQLPSISTDHRCYATKTPSSPSSRVQDLFCVNGGYRTCVHFLQAEIRKAGRNPSAPPLIGRVHRVLGRLV